MLLYKHLKPIMLILALGLSLCIQGKELIIEPANTPPIIDGDDTDMVWQVVPWQNLDQSGGNTNNFAAKFKMCFDNNNIYILVWVDDITPYEDGSTTWQSDCVELFFAMDTNSSYSYREGDWHIRKIASKSQEEGGVDGFNPNYDNTTILLNDANFIVQQKDYVNYYVQEWQIPIQTLIQSANFNGNSFRFDMLVANNDGTGNERTGTLFWNSNFDDQWSAVIHQGYVLMNTSHLLPEDTAFISMKISRSYYIDTVTSFYDSGGPLGNYANNEYKVVTVYPAQAGYAINVVFDSIHIESCCDYLKIFDGESINAPLLAMIKGDNDISTITASNPSGALTFLFYSDNSENYSGFAGKLIPANPVVSPISLNLNFNDTLATFTVNAKGYQWILYETADWISLSPVASKDSGQVDVKTTVNSGTNNRSANITITMYDSANNVLQYTVMVTQKAQDNYLTVSIDSIKVDGKKDTVVTFTVNSNTDWTAYCFFNYNYTVKGPNSWEFKLTIPPNDRLSESMSFLTFSWADKNYYYHELNIPIIQGIGIYGVDKKLLTLKKDTDSTFFHVTSIGGSWQVSSPFSWITIQPNSGSNDTDVMVKVNPNPYAYTREGYIWINFPDRSGSVSISQEPALPYFSLEIDTLYISYRDTELVIGKTNTLWNCNTWSTWASIYSSDTLIMLFVAQNPYTESRQVSLNVDYYAGYWHRKTVYVVQEAALIGISKSSVKLGYQKGAQGQFNITANGYWSISHNASWLDVNPASGTGNATITVTSAQRNEDFYQRNAELVLTFADDTNLNPIIKVTQAASPFQFDVLPRAVNLSQDKQEQFVMVTSNTKWWIISAPDFVEMDIYPGDQVIYDRNFTVRYNGDSWQANENRKDYIVIVNDYEHFFYIPVIYTNNAVIPSSYIDIFKTYTPLNIDGKDDEEVWQTTNSQDITKSNGETDHLSASFKMCYDDNYIYVLVKVNDSTSAQIGNTTWQSDNVELYFSMDTTSSFSYRSGDWQIRKLIAKSASEGIDGSANVTRLLEDPNFRVEQTNGDGYYIQEWQLPIKILSDSVFFDYTWFRFDIQVADNNGTNTRTGQLFWNSKYDEQKEYIYNKGYVRMAGILKQRMLSKNMITFMADDTRKDTVYIFTREWFQVSANQNWIHVGEESSPEQRYLVISVDNNTTLKQRSGTITLTNPFTELNIAVVQEPYTGITDKANRSIILYPNPVGDILRVSILDGRKIGEVKLFSVEGKLLLNAKVDQSTSLLSMTQFKSGIYLLQITLSDGTNVFRKIQKK